MFSELQNKYKTEAMRQSRREQSVIVKRQLSELFPFEFTLRHHHRLLLLLHLLLLNLDNHL